MSAHTPGPWHRNIKPASRYPTVWAGRNTHVAAVTSTNPEADANCDLVTAAPDLLAALQLTLTFARIKWGNLDADANKAFELAEAAISKATGEAS